MTSPLPPATTGRHVDHARRDLVLASVARHGGNMAAAARELGCPRATVRSTCRRAKGLDHRRKPKPPPVLPVAPHTEPRRTLVRVPVADYRTGVERRRFDCAYLATCEDEWARAYGGEQGMCVGGCRGYVQRDFVKPISLCASGATL